MNNKCKCGHEKEDHRNGSLECLCADVIDAKEIECDCEDFDEATGAYQKEDQKWYFDSEKGVTFGPYETKDAADNDSAAAEAQGY